LNVFEREARMRFLAAHFMVVAALTSPALAQPDTANDPDIGVYAFSGGREAYIEYLPGIPGLAMVEFPSGRVRPLRRTGEHAFTFGPAIVAAEPVVAASLLRRERRASRTDCREARRGRGVTNSEQCPVVPGADPEATDRLWRLSERLLGWHETASGTCAQVGREGDRAVPDPVPAASLMSG
jgi:hypothetical protein